MKATVTAKGQITIPHLIRKRLNLQTGSILEFDEKAHFLIARRAVDPQAIKKMRSVIGCAKGSKLESSSDWIEETRGPVELPPSLNK